MESDRSKTAEVKGEKQKSPSPPIPSASVLVVSPANQILLLQRVRNTRSFASAYVFPGGNLSDYHDGSNLPPQDAEEFHQDRLEYRLAAIRETFEESGLLLARKDSTAAELLVAELEEGRRLVHTNKVPFTTWLAQRGRHADVEGLIPFTRWISPTHADRRYSTQMYVYFLPMHWADTYQSPMKATGKEWVEDEVGGRSMTVTPTTDGGLEHINARFLQASAWCKLAQEGSIVIFPPQFFLLHVVAKILDTEEISGTAGQMEMKIRRHELIAFIQGNEGGDDAPWTEKCVSPHRLGVRTEDGREIMAMYDPGYELQGAARSGVMNTCMLFDMQSDGPRRLEVVDREAVRPRSSL